MSRSVSDALRTSTEEGFTLVEALLTMTLISLLSIAVLGAIHFVSTAWQKSQVHNSRAERFLQVHSLLRRHLEQAAPAFVPRPGKTGFVRFDGQKTQLSFLTPAPASLRGSGRLYMRLALAETANGRALRLSWQPERPGPEPAQPEPAKLLLDEIEAFALSYYGVRLGEDEAAWHESWQDQPSLPQLIRIDLSRKTDGTIPPIIIRPRIAVDVTCVYDPLTRGCQGRS